MKLPKLFVIALSGCLLLGTLSANAQPQLGFDWLYLDCEASETTEGICPEFDEGYVPFASRCVVAVSELKSQGWRLLAMERINRTQITVQLFSKGFETRALYCIFEFSLTFP